MSGNEKTPNCTPRVNPKQMWQRAAKAALKRDSSLHKKAAHDSSFYSRQDSKLHDLHQTVSRGKSGCITGTEFRAQLERLGLELNDLRLTELRRRLEDVERSGKVIDMKTFQWVVKPCMTLVNKAFQNQLVIKDWVGFQVHFFFFFRIRNGCLHGNANSPRTLTELSGHS